MDGAPGREFETAAHQQADGNLFVELWLFLRDNKKWWLLPILAVLVLFGLLMLLAGTGAAPFIYTLF
jgi:drug/metabolite transporter superfamily protein YnfA